MKMLFSTMMFALVFANIARSQSIVQRWHVNDAGGGRSSGGGLLLFSSIGQNAVRAMSAGGQNLESGYIPGIRSGAGFTAVTQVQPEGGWNLLSLPVLTDDPRVRVLFPTALSSAFSYQGGYSKRDSLDNGSGYWIKFPDSTLVNLGGTTITQETVKVSKNWNLIGCPSYPGRISDITAVGTNIRSPYFGYSSASGYFVEDTLKPGSGYWLKTDTVGKLVLWTGSVLAVPAAPTKTGPAPGSMLTDLSQHGGGILTVQDALGFRRSLYFCSSSENSGLEQYELPPAAPSGMDVRYTDNRMMVLADPHDVKRVKIQIVAAEYPLTISWKSSVVLINAAPRVDGEAYRIKGQGEAQVSTSESQVRLQLAPASSVRLPREFALSQNYPNPFNPTTRLSYAIPRDQHVSITVYNVLGQVMATVVDEFESAGYKSVEFDAGRLPSGTYFYRLRAGTFTDVRKMLLMR